jgi:hypothetical protein
VCDEDGDSKDDELARLNILIAICGSYFGQSEELACLYEGEHVGDGEEEEDEGESMEEDDEFGDEEEGEENENEVEKGVESMEEEEDCTGGNKRRRLQPEVVVSKTEGSYELEDGEEIE